MTKSRTSSAEGRTPQGGKTPPQPLVGPNPFENEMDLTNELIEKLARLEKEREVEKLEFAKLKSELTRYTTENTRFLGELDRSQERQQATEEDWETEMAGKYTDLLAQVTEIKETLKAVRGSSKSKAKASAQPVASTDEESSESDYEDSVELQTEVQTMTQTDTLPPPSPRRAGPKRAKFLLDAYRNVRTIITCDITPSNIDPWVRSSYATMASLFPDLDVADILSVLSRRLPKDNIEYVLDQTKGCREVGEFIVLLKNIYGVSLDRSDARYEGLNQFFSAQPALGSKFVSLQDFVWEVIKLSENLINVTRVEKNRYIVSKISGYLPQVFREQLRRNVRTKKDASIFTILTPILSADARREVEGALRAFKAPPPYPIHQVGTSSPEGEINQVATGGEKKEDKEKILTCARCGIKQHKTSDCPIYKTRHNRFCSLCQNLFAVKLWHEEAACSYKKHLESESN